MVINVIGLGNSAHRYNGKGISIGVNDCWSIHPCDYVVCVDKPERFNDEPDRLVTIKASKPILFFSHLDEWMFMNGFIQMNLASHRGDLSEIDTKYPYSISSSYCAVGIAYKLGAKQIDIYGVDMNDHKTIKDAIKDSEVRRFRELFKVLQGKGVRVRVTKESVLSEFIKSF